MLPDDLASVLPDDLVSVLPDDFASMLPDDLANVLPDDLFTRVTYSWSSLFMIGMPLGPPYALCCL